MKEFEEAREDSVKRLREMRGYYGSCVYDVQNAQTEVYNFKGTSMREWELCEGRIISALTRSVSGLEEHYNNLEVE